MEVLTIVPFGGGTASVAGSNTEIQYNDNGSLGASADLTWDDAGKELGVGGDINLDSGGAYSTTLQMVTATANRTISFPDATGTVALVSGSNGTVQYNEGGVLKGNSDFAVDPDWNDAAVTFTGLKLNVTDTASAAGSKLLDLQRNGTSFASFNVSSGLSSLELPAASTLFIDKNSTNGMIIGNYAGRHIRLGSATSILFSSGPPAGSIDLQIKRDQANVLAVTDGSTGTGYIKQDPVAVSALPAAATVGAGTRGFVNDANATTFASVVAGGGANVVPVYSDGTNWRIG